MCFCGRDHYRIDCTHRVLLQKTERGPVTGDGFHGRQALHTTAVEQTVYPDIPPSYTESVSNEQT